MQQSKVSVQYSEENSVFGRVSYYLLLKIFWEPKWGGRALIRGCALINFFCLYDGRLISMWILRLGGDRRKKK